MLLFGPTATRSNQSDTVIRKSIVLSRSVRYPFDPCKALRSRRRCDRHPDRTDCYCFSIAHFTSLTPSPLTVVRAKRFRRPRDCCRPRIIIFFSRWMISEYFNVTPRGAVATATATTVVVTHQFIPIASLSKLFTIKTVNVRSDQHENTTTALLKKHVMRARFEAKSCKTTRRRHRPRDPCFFHVRGFPTRTDPIEDCDHRKRRRVRIPAVPRFVYERVHGRAVDNRRCYLYMYVYICVERGSSEMLFGAYKLLHWVFIYLFFFRGIRFSSEPVYY